MTICAILLAPAPNVRIQPRRIALAAVAALCRPVITPGDEKLRQELSGLPVDVIGDASFPAALKTALALTPHLDAAVLLRPDQPNVSAAAIGRLCSTFRGTHAAIVASEYDHTIGLPALFGRSVFEELLALPPEADPKRVIAGRAPQVATIPLPEAAAQIESSDEYALLHR